MQRGTVVPQKQKAAAVVLLVSQPSVTYAVGAVQPVNDGRKVLREQRLRGGPVLGGGIIPCHDQRTCQHQRGQRRHQQGQTAAQCSQHGGTSAL